MSYDYRKEAEKVHREIMDSPIGTYLVDEYRIIELALISADKRARAEERDICWQVATAELWNHPELKKKVSEAIRRLE